MDSIELAPGIVIYKNVIENYNCLINDIEDAVNVGMLRWSPAGIKSEDSVVIDKKQRDTESIGIGYEDSGDELTNQEKESPKFFETYLSRIFFRYFNPCEVDYKAKFNFNTDWHDLYGILKYGVGQKFINHIDDHRDYHRRMSSVYYINDNYSGGEINFPRFNITYKPKANELIIFPSTYVYNHSVSEITSGTRYAIVSWMK